MAGLEYLLAALTPLNLLLALTGVVAGTMIGAIPGLTATMAVAVLVPLTFAMPTATALILMGAIYTGAIYGGAYSAILLNTPGTPSAIATTFDGYPLAREGNGDLAITIACLASVFGGLVGAVTLLTLAPPLSGVALAFGPVEYFWLAILGLSLIGALSEGNLLKGIAAGGLGMLLSCIGVAEVSADIRLTFGSQTLLGGIQVVAAMIGLFCIPVLIDLVATPDRHLKAETEARGFRLPESLAYVWRDKINAIRSALVGTFVGILPGAGGSIASLVAYSEARRTARPGQRYGKGEPGGVVASESANNATVGGGFVPTLVLGIPGTPPDAVILGALLVQGVRTGPTLFTQQGEIVYTFIWGLILATVMMLPAGLLIGRYAYRTIVTLPKALLVPSIAFMTVIGSYAIRNSIADVIMMIVLGAAGWVLGRFAFGAAPIVLGLILGPIAEQGFVQAWTIGGATGDRFGMFFGRPISLAIIAFTLLTLLSPLLMRRLRPQKEAVASAAPRPDTGGTLVAALLIAVACFALWETTLYVDADSAVFPRTVGLVMIVASLGYILLWLLGGGHRLDAPDKGSWARRALLIAVMLAGALAMPQMGFLLAAIPVFGALLLVAMHDPWTPYRTAVYPAVGIAVIAGFYYVFQELLQVPLPTASLF